MKNLTNHQTGKSLAENSVLEPSDLDAWRNEREEMKNLNKLNRENRKEVEKKKKLKEEEDGVNILGPELYELVFGRLSFKIRLSNIKIYFENDNRVPRGINSVDQPFSILLHLRGFSFNSEDIQNFIKKDGQFKDLVHIEKLINTLPNSNSTKILYFLLKIARISVHFYSGVEHLVDVDTPVLRHSNKNVLKKLEYFDILDEVRPYPKL